MADPAGSGGEPTYYPQNDPEFTLNCINDEYGRPDHGCPIDSTKLGANFKLKVPAGATPEGVRSIVVGQPRNYDSHMIIIDQTNGWEYDLWQVQSTSSFDSVRTDGTVAKGLSAQGGHIDFSWGGRTRWSSANDGTAVNRPSGDPVSDSNAAHWAELAGRVRAEELASGDIGHALFIVVPCVTPSAVFPADPVGRGWECGKNNVQAALGAHPLGTRFYLDMSVEEVNALPVPDWKKTFLRAMSRYGMFVGDTGGAGWLFYVETEGGNMYSSLTDPATGNPYQDKWFTFASQNQWEPYTPPNGPQQYVGKLYTSAGDSYDWAGKVWPRLRVLDTCVTTAGGGITC